MATFLTAAAPPPVPDQVRSVAETSYRSGPRLLGASHACDHPNAPARSENCAPATPSRSDASTISAAPRPTAARATRGPLVPSGSQHLPPHRGRRLRGPPDLAPGDPDPTPRLQ